MKKNLILGAIASVLAASFALALETAMYPALTCSDIVPMPAPDTFYNAQ